MRQNQFIISKRNTVLSRILFVSMFAVVGTIVISVLRAQGPSVSFEAEDGANLNIRPDSNASNNFYYEFSSSQVSPVGAADCHDETHHFVSVTGTEEGDGSCVNPWDLRSALVNDQEIQPGHTLWIDGGQYSSDYLAGVDLREAGRRFYFYHRLYGTDELPIKVRAMSGERVTLVSNMDTFSGENEPAVLTIAGDHTYFYDLEVTSTKQSRVDGSSECNRKRPGVEILQRRGGPGVPTAEFLSSVGNKFIGMVIHNNGTGFEDAGGYGDFTEIADSLIYYNGRWCPGQNKSVGNGIHAYSHVGEVDEPKDDLRLFQNNILFDNAEEQFRSRFSIRGNGRSGGLANFYLLDNTVFTTGMFQVRADRDLTPTQIVDERLLDANIRIGTGSHEARDGVIRNNVTFYPLEYPGRNGWWRWKNKNFHMGGIKTSGSPGHLGGCIRSVWTDNYSVGGNGWWVHPTCFPSEYDYPPLNNNSGPETVENNTFIGTNVPNSGQEDIASEGDQQYYMDYYPNNTWIDKDDPDALPTENWVSITRSQHVQGRAFVRVFNWSEGNSFTVDLSQTGLREGQSYEIRDAQNYFGDPLASGIYGGELPELFFSDLIKSQPTNPGSEFRTNIPHTTPLFSTFIVVPDL